MADRLIIGTKMYSSWSLRGWLAVHLAGLSVEEVVIPLAGGTTAAVKAATPSGTVPYLEHDGARIWESLSILEYCAEQAPGLWPADPVRRAQARSIASEMHAGFRNLRLTMPMTILHRFAPKPLAPEVQADIDRIEAIWAEALAQSGGPFLFGAEMGAADAMFAPVACRFLTWQPDLTATSQAYVQAVRQHPLMQRWYAEAAAEPAEWRLAKFESAA